MLFLVCVSSLGWFNRARQRESWREKECVCGREREREGARESNLPEATGDLSVYDQRSIPNSFCSHRKLSEAALSKIDGWLERASERARAR